MYVFNLLHVGLIKADHHTKSLDGAGGESKYHILEKFCEVYILQKREKNQFLFLWIDNGIKI